LKALLFSAIRAYLRWITVAHRRFHYVILSS
jgi:hypothetical protein